MLRHLHLTPTLTVVIGLFVAATAGLVLAVQAITSDRVAREMGAELVTTGMTALRREFTGQLDNIEEQAAFISRAIKTGTVLLEGDEGLGAFTFGSLAGTPQVSLIAIIPAGASATVIQRGADDGVLVTARVPRDGLPAALGTPDKWEGGREAFWTPVSYRAAMDQSLVTYILPVWKDDTFLGTVAVGVSLDLLSAFTARISGENLKVYLIYDDTHLLAHPDLLKVRPDRSVRAPMVPLDQAPDPFLRAYGSMEILEASHTLPERMTLRVGVSDTGERRLLVTEVTAEEFGALPVTVGSDFPAAYLEHSFDELYQALLIGIAMLGMSLVGAALLAHSIAKPVRRAAESANRVAGLDLEHVAPLPPSPITELDSLARGFNAMVAGLRAFNRYVPKALVEKLLAEGRAEAPPETRRVAVLFTDIAGFTSVCEGATASETANFINDHLALIGGQVRAHGGTIDKYIGDSVMAFWGAPEEIDNPAEQAAHAALAIARALKEDNRARAARGLQPVRLRIGLHVGPLVVGDIGAPERVNYTVIGDTVNIASRLESLGKEIDPGAEVIILCSREVAGELDRDIGIADVGSQQVKGRGQAVDVLRLLP